MSQPERDAEINEWLGEYWDIKMTHEQRMRLATQLGWGITHASYPFEVLTPSEKDSFWDWWAEENNR